MAEIRAFIAVKIDERIREMAASLQRTLNRGDSRVKWVETNNLHLTLKFLGDIPEDNLPLYYQALERGASDFSPFKVTFQGLGAFPNLKRPRVLWMGVREGKEKLSALSKSISSSLVQASLLEEKELKSNRFSPHLTLGRVRSQKNLEDIMEILKDKQNILVGTMEINQIHLIKSTLTPKGPHYEALKNFSL